MSVISNFNPISKKATNWSLKRRLIAHVVKTFKENVVAQRAKEVVTEDDQYALQALKDVGSMLRFVDYYRFFLVPLDNQAFQTIEEGEKVSARRRYTAFDSLASLLSSHHLFDDKQLQAVFNGSLDKDVEKIRERHPLLLVCRLEDETNSKLFVNSRPSTHPILTNKIKTRYQLELPNLLYFIIKRKPDERLFSDICAGTGFDELSGLIFTVSTGSLELTEENLLEAKQYFDKTGMPYILEPIDDYTNAEKYNDSVAAYGHDYGYALRLAQPSLLSITEVFDVDPTLKEKPLNASDLLLTPPIDEQTRKNIYDSYCIYFKKGELTHPEWFKQSNEELMDNYVDNAPSYISPFEANDKRMRKVYHAHDILSAYESIVPQDHYTGLTLTYPTFGIDYENSRLDSFLDYNKFIGRTSINLANDVLYTTNFDDYLE